eukprot:COSAG01_NODE_3316_length_6272_cov_4.305376_5_plen_94_part_00
METPGSPLQHRAVVVEHREWRLAVDVEVVVEAVVVDVVHQTTHEQHQPGSVACPRPDCLARCMAGMAELRERENPSQSQAGGAPGELRYAGGY